MAVNKGVPLFLFSGPSLDALPAGAPSPQPLALKRDDAIQRGLNFNFGSARKPDGDLGGLATIRKYGQVLLVLASRGVRLGLLITSSMPKPCFWPKTEEHKW